MIDVSPDAGVFALAATVFASSLLGSVHCAGMCGGFVGFYAGAAQGPRDGTRRFAAHVAYHVARLLTYASVGALFGALGAGVDRAGALAGVGRAAAFGAAIVMTLWGGYLLLQAFGLDPGLTRRLPSVLVRGIAAVHTRLAERPPVVRAAVLGLTSTLLPCGWLYAFAVVAAGTGSPFAGAILMAVFWAGTVPILAALGAGVAVVAAPLRRHLPVVTALALIAVGIVALWGRAGALASTDADGTAHPPGCPLHAVDGPRDAGGRSDRP